MKDAVVKVNSYMHDEAGITSEEAALVNQMTRKRLRKWEVLSGEMQAYPGVMVSGNPDAPVALLCWGSTKGVCNEIALLLGLKVIQLIVLSPFPVIQVKKAISGVKKLVVVEENATGQLASLAEQHGMIPDHRILRYDGRPFPPEDLMARLKEVIL